MAWHEVAYPVIILKSYDHFGMVVHSQTLHIEITTECWYSPLEIGHLESRLAVLLTDTLLSTAGLLDNSALRYDQLILQLS